MTTVTVDETGKLGLPEEVLVASHIKPGAELVVITDAGRILLVERKRLLEHRMDTLDREMRARARRAIEEGADGSLFAGLSAAEYLALTDQEDEQLWNRLAEEAEEATETVEQEIPPHFRPARQGGRARGASRRRPH